MAKKTQRKATAKSRRPKVATFVVHRQEDLAKLMSVAAKGPGKDLTGTKLVKSEASAGAFNSDITRLVSASDKGPNIDQSGTRPLASPTFVAGPGAFKSSPRGNN